MKLMKLYQSLTSGRQSGLLSLDFLQHQNVALTCIRPTCTGGKIPVLRPS
jgi:hypothetical protein